MSIQSWRTSALTLAVLSASALPAFAQDKAPEALSLYFSSGSAQIRSEDQKVLDQASRLYRDGNPIVMIVAGSSDAAGSASSNLRLSIERANSVVRGLVERGIPVERFQVVGKGETDPAVPASGRAEQQNRRVDITWR